MEELNKKLNDDAFFDSCKARVRYDKSVITTFLMCLKHRPDLPQLPLEMVLSICRRLKVRKCNFCEKLVDADAFYNDYVCSRSCHVTVNARRLRGKSSYITLLTIPKKIF